MIQCFFKNEVVASDETRESSVPQTNYHNSIVNSSIHSLTWKSLAILEPYPIVKRSVIIYMDRIGKKA